MLHASGPTGTPKLERRTPGQTDLRVFTAEVMPAGKHRVERSRPRPRVVRDRLTGRPMLRVVTPGAESADTLREAALGR